MLACVQELERNSIIQQSANHWRDFDQLWAGSGDVNNVSIGDLTVNMAMGSSLDDFNIYIWATSGTIDTVSVGDLDVTVGAGADFDDYQFQAWATNMVNTVTLGDITAVVEPGKTNQIALFCTRTVFNELGTGGLIGPVAIYRDK